MPIEIQLVRKTAIRSLLAYSQAALVLCVLQAGLRGQCDVVVWGQSNQPIRVGPNGVMTSGQTWTAGDVYGYWTPSEEAWQLLWPQGSSSGAPITGGALSSANPGSTAESTWTTVLNSAGPGTYWDYSAHWAVADQSACPGLYVNTFYSNGSGLTIARPTITGTSAFWWLGNGVLLDRGYYAQSALTANPLGASGSPYWSVHTAGTGSVSLQCSVCGSNVATSTAPSRNCTPDITINASYGGFDSDAFNVTIVAPSTLTLQSGFPQDAAFQGGFLSLYQWGLTDTCGGQDANLDGNEVFGSWTDDYFNSTGTHNNWGRPTAVSAWSLTNQWTDIIWAKPCTGGIPKCQNPQSPLSSVKVMHNAPWTFYFGTQMFGSGVPVERDTQQWFLDHCRHQ
jgi:hypothetical protein